MLSRFISSRSNMLSIAMVAAAGVITFYGLSTSGASGQPEGSSAAAGAPDLVIPPAADRVLPALGPEAVSNARPGLPTRVVVPSADISAPIRGVGIVVEDGAAQWETSDRAVGHHLDSALPGGPGNVVLTGHVSVASDEAIPYFETLRQARVGDIVEVHSGSAVFRYRIEDLQRVSPETTSVLRSDHRSRVTLITCTPDLRDRLIVVGSLIT
ncbi:MAG: sortase [Dehalococcoidia bacterium]|nr:sortase [Dehalococcoidia bacterium]